MSRPSRKSMRNPRPGTPYGLVTLFADSDEFDIRCSHELSHMKGIKRAARTNRKGPALGLGQHMAVVLVIIAVAAESPSAMRQRAELNAKYGAVLGGTLIVNAVAASPSGCPNPRLPRRGRQRRRRAGCSSKSRRERCVRRRIWVAAAPLAKAR